MRPALVEVTDDIVTLKRICESEIDFSFHFHIVRYPRGEAVSGPIHDRKAADRIAHDVSVLHPDVQIHVRQCERGEWCGR